MQLTQVCSIFPSNESLTKIENSRTFGEFWQLPMTGVLREERVHIFILTLSFQLYAGDLKDDLKSASSDADKISVLAEMGKSGEAKYVKPMTEQLEKGESSKIRAQAATSLGELKAGINELHKAYDNDDVYVREASIEALAKIGNAKSQSYFEKGAKDKNEKFVFLAFKDCQKLEGVEMHLSFVMRSNGKTNQLNWQPFVA